MRESSSSNGEKTVYVADMSGIKKAVVDADATVEEVLEELGLSTDLRIKFNGQEVELDDVPDNGDELNVVKKVEGHA